jgi:hypothetical protein
MEVLIPSPLGIVDSISGDPTFGLEWSRRLPNDGGAAWTGAVDGLVRPREATLGDDPNTGDWRLEGGLADGGDLRVNVTLVAGDHWAANVIGYLNAGAASASVGTFRLRSEGTEEGM